MLFTTLMCHPEELAALQDVYKRILCEAWFARSETNERDFEKAIVRFFQQRIVDEERLFVEALALARARYSADVVKTNHPPADHSS